MFRAGARDWTVNGRRIAFDGENLAPGFEPQFHHIFPRKYLQGHPAGDYAETLANIAVIGASTNIKISAQSPMDYFDKYGIDEIRRAEQFIEGPLTSMQPRNVAPWLRRRADRLAEATNGFLKELRSDK